MLADGIYARIACIHCRWQDCLCATKFQRQSREYKRRIGSSAAIASCWPRTCDDIQPAMQANGRQNIFDTQLAIDGYVQLSEKKL